MSAALLMRVAVPAQHSTNKSLADTLLQCNAAACRALDMESQTALLKETLQYVVHRVQKYCLCFQVKQASHCVAEAQELQ